MKKQVLFLSIIIAIVFASCSTAYKTGQTPDDLYYSPERSTQEEYQRYDDRDEARYESADEYYDDRYLRMKVHNRRQWNELNDWYYYGNRYGYSNMYYSGYWNNPWTPHSYWNTCYNPYYSGYYTGTIVVKNSSYRSPRKYNLNTYNNTAGNNSKTRNSYSQSNYNARETKRTNQGNSLRNTFRGSSSSEVKTPSSQNSNSGSSSSSSSARSSSSSGGSAPSRKF